MEKLNILIRDHNDIDKSRSSLSNLIKKIKLDNELFIFIENYMSFGTFKQKLHHIINNLSGEILICSVCNDKRLNWVEKDNKYRSVCSAKCCGKLTGTKNLPKRDSHPGINNNEEFIIYFNSNKIKLVESSLSKIYPNLVKSINNSINFETKLYSEKVYFYLYDLKQRPICDHCKYNIVEFDTFTKGYQKYCSVKCSSNSEYKKEIIKNTCIEKYGVKNIGMVTRDKALETMNEKYGSHISKTKEYKEKYRNTCIEKYGVEHYSIVDELNNFRIKNPMKDNKIVENSLKTKKENGLIYKWSNEELNDIRSYRRSVSYYTEKTYEEYKEILNPDNLDRGVHTNHIDHIYPVIEGWKNKIDPKMISNYKNLKLIDSYDNLSKGERTDITIDDFFKMLK
jgi:hypothetical protein